jgi:hypothetical protein
MMNIRNQLLVEMLGYFRKSNESQDEGTATAVRYLMIVAMEYQRGGATAAYVVMNTLNMPERYTKALMETLEKDCQ